MTKNFKVNLISLLFISSFIINAQKITGLITDEKGTPIPYATIQVDNNHATISNDDGAFSIQLNIINENASVIISCLGYFKSQIPVKDFKSGTYIIKEQIDHLPQIQISTKKIEVATIIFNANKNLNKNYKYKHNTYGVFNKKTEELKGKQCDLNITKSYGYTKQELKSFNLDFDKLENQLLNNNTKQYVEFLGDLHVSSKEKPKLDIKKALKSFDENNSISLENIFKRGNEIILKHLSKDKVYTVKSGFLKLSDSVSLKNNQEKIKDTINSLGHVKFITNELLKKYMFYGEDNLIKEIINTNKYTHEVKDVKFIDGEMVYMISFYPSWFSSAPLSGIIYISADSFAVIKLDYHYYKNKSSKKVNLKFLLGLKYEEKNKTGIVLYKQFEDGFYYPYYICEKAQRYFYVERSTKFIENNNRKQKAAFEFLIEGILNEKNEYIILSKTDLINSEFDKYQEKKRMDYEVKKAYDKSFWDSYNILNPMEENKSK